MDTRIYMLINACTIIAISCTFVLMILRKDIKQMLDEIEEYMKKEKTLEEKCKSGVIIGEIPRLKTIDEIIKEIAVIKKALDETEQDIKRRNKQNENKL